MKLDSNDYEALEWILTIIEIFYAPLLIAYVLKRRKRRKDGTTHTG
jgi:hypothetical protein